jgi:hypothetical protein
MRWLSLTIAMCCFICVRTIAQERPPDAPSSSATSPGTQSGPQNDTDQQGKLAFVELVQKKSLVFPDLARDEKRLTSWQKFQLAANNSVALSTAGVAIIAAGWGQAVDHPSGYGEGGEAYGKRFGADMARSASDNLLGTFLIASVLREDPRFYVKRNLSFKQTVKYAAIRLVVTRSDAGHSAPNFAGLLGPLASEELANTYYPEDSRSAGSTFLRYASDLGWRFGGNVLRQYWPRINKKLHQLPPTTGPTPPPVSPR